jgi:hypothetical protein
MILNFHEDKCVNKHRWILKTDYKKQTIVLSVIFLLVATMFIVPAITEKALATIFGNAVSTRGDFHNIGYHISPGFFVCLPMPCIKNYGNVLQWKTTGLGGSERGYVSARVGTAQVFFHFSNPFRGPNTCSVEPPGQGSCTITQGNTAHANFQTPGSSLLDDDDPDIGDLQDQLQEKIFKGIIDECPGCPLSQKG